MADYKVGKITHYFDKIMVAVVELYDTLSVGDDIKIVNKDAEFTMKVTSMQVEHQQIDKAKKGDTIGMKLDQPAEVGSEVFRVNQ